MISNKQFQDELQFIIKNAIREDVGPGDYSSLACIPIEAVGKAKLLVKDSGIVTRYCLYSDYSILDLNSLVNSGSLQSAPLKQVLTQPLP